MVEITRIFQKPDAFMCSSLVCSTVVEGNLSFFIHTNSRVPSRRLVKFYKVIPIHLVMIPRN